MIKGGVEGIDFPFFLGGGAKAGLAIPFSRQMTLFLVF